MTTSFRMSTSFLILCLLLTIPTAAQNGGTNGGGENKRGENKRGESSGKSNGDDARVELPESIEGLSSLEALDYQLFRRIYSFQLPPVRKAFETIDDTGYPLFYGAVPASAALALLTPIETDLATTYRLALSELIAVQASQQLKRTVKRRRPQFVLNGVDIRFGDGEAPEETDYAFPSGHAAAAAAIVTPAGLSHPEWYVITPGALWVSSIALSRIWRGRHFPGDVVAGALLGGAVATSIHLLDPLITPDFLRDEDDPIQAPVFNVRLPLK